MARPRPQHAALTLLAIALGCGPSGETAEELASTKRMMALDSAIRASLPPEFGTEHPFVPKGELLCAEADFAGHLRRVDTVTFDTALITVPKRPVKVADMLSLLNAVQPCPPVGPIERGVIVHYGLDSAGALDVRLQMVCLTYDAASAQYTCSGSDDCLRIMPDGGLVAEPRGLAAWRSPGGGWYNYRRQVIIKPDHDSGWSPIDERTEPSSAIHAETGLRDLIAQNGIGNGMLALTAIATPQHRAVLPDSTYAEMGFHHGMAWTPLNEALDDSSYSGSPFMRKALDLGTPCPYACTNSPFRFWPGGTPPRSGCR